MRKEVYYNVKALNKRENIAQDVFVSNIIYILFEKNVYNKP